MAEQDVIDESGTDAPDRLRVFLSYSRQNEAFMRQIADALKARGFEPDFDQATYDPHQISGGISAEDEWWVRIQEMIAACDVMLFMVSPGSSGSVVCDEEIAYARALGKRIIAVKVQDIDFAKAPPRLAALNVQIDFSESGPGFDAAMDATALALNTDVSWHREGRRLFDRISEWDRKERPNGLLLREGALVEAEAWSARRPSNEEAPGDLFFAYLEESRKRVAADLRRQRFWRRVTAVVGLAAMALTAWGAYSTIQGARNVSLATSRVIAPEASIAFEQWRYDRALKFSVLAATDTSLSPAAPGSQLGLARAIQHNRLSGILNGGSGRNEPDADPPLMAPDGSAIINFGHSSALSQWRKQADGSWQHIPLIEGDSLHHDRTMAGSVGDQTHIFVNHDENYELWSHDDTWTWSGEKITDRETLLAERESEELGTFKEIQFDKRRFLPSVNHIAVASGPIFEEDRIKLANLWVRSEAGEWEMQELAYDLQTDAGLEPEPVSDEPVSEGAQEQTDTTNNTPPPAMWNEVPMRINKVYVEPAGQLIIVEVEGSVRGSGTDSWGSFIVFERAEAGTWSSRLINTATRGVFFSPKPGVFATRSKGQKVDIWEKDDAGQWQSSGFGDVTGPSFKRTIPVFSNSGDMLVYNSFTEERNGTRKSGVAHLVYRNQYNRWMSRKLITKASAINSVNGPHDSKFDHIRSYAWSDNDKFLALGFWGGQVLVYEITGALDWQKQPILKEVIPFVGHQSAINWLEFTADGTQLFSRDDTGEIRIWDTAHLEYPPRTEIFVSRAGYDAKFIDGGKKIVASQDGASRRGLSNSYLSLWERDATGEWVNFGDWTSAAVKDHLGGQFVGISDAGDRFVTRVSQTELQIWDRTQDGPWEKTQKLAVHSALETNPTSIIMIDLAPSGKSILTIESVVDEGERSNTLKIWQETSDGTWPYQTLQSGISAINSVKFAPDERYFVSYGEHEADWDNPEWTRNESGIVTVWSRDKDNIWTPDTYAVEKNIAGIAIAPDSQSFIIGRNWGNDGLVYRWARGADGAWARESTGAKTNFEAAHFSADGKQILLQSVKDPIETPLYRKTLAGPWILEKIHDRPSVTASNISPDGRFLFTRIPQAPTLLTRDTSENIVEIELSTASSALGSLADFSSDGQSLLLSGEAVSVFDISALTSDSSRKRAAKLGATFSNQGKHVDRACVALLAFKITETDPETGELLSHYPRAVLTKEDFDASPRLKSFGFAVGDNVCELSQPSVWDRILSEIIPRGLWSEL